MIVYQKFLIVRSEMSDLGKNVCDLSSEISDVGKNVYDMSFEISDVGKNVCDMSSEISDVGKNVCDISSEISDVGKNGMICHQKFLMIHNYGSEISDICIQLSLLNSVLICDECDCPWCAFSRQVLQDDFVALLCPKYNERPQVAIVKKVHPESITVEWYDGSWTSTWKQYTYKLGRRAGRT